MKFEDKYCIVMKYYPTSLRSMIDKKEYIDEDTIKKWMIELADGLNYLHKNHIVHPALSTQNLYILHNDIFICDYAPTRDYFDLKKQNSNDSSGSGKKKKKKQINYYLPPEKYKEGEEITYKSNLWCLGCILYEILCGNPPFTEENDAAQAKSVINKPTPEDALLGYGNDVFAEIIQMLLRKDPKQRYILKTIINHPYLNNSIYIIIIIFIMR